MTTPEHTPAPDLDDSVDSNATSGDPKPAMKDHQHYKGSGKSNHDKRPGVAPSGTRRSMGKR
jgi:hypothetical protein